MFRAIRDALIGKTFEHYPLNGESKGTIDTDELIGLIVGQVKGVKFANVHDAKPYIDLAKNSLDEVKQLTEYQDQKASRLLTIIAFLTAAAGAIFPKITETYPYHHYADLPLGPDSLVLLLYWGFFAFVVLVVSGALVTFHATQTRFVWPKGNSDSASEEKVKSFLFFRSILTTKPEVWGKAFCNDSNATEPSVSMLSDYYKNYIVEAYLVACKVGDKLRYLGPAQNILLFAIRVLLLWILILALTFILVRPLPKSDGSGAKLGDKVEINATLSPTVVNAITSFLADAKVAIRGKAEAHISGNGETNANGKVEVNFPVTKKPAPPRHKPQQQVKLCQCQPMCLYQPPAAKDCVPVPPQEGLSDK